jgi:hypothetical protein
MKGTNQRISIDRVFLAFQIRPTYRKFRQPKAFQLIDISRFIKHYVRYPSKKSQAPTH